MEKFFETLKRHIAEHPPNFGDGESVLTMLYECYNENNPYDNEQIRTDFNELYQQMNGMPLREMDQIVYPVCKLCRDHERAGFAEGIKIGVRLHAEITEELRYCCYKYKNRKRMQSAVASGNWCGGQRQLGAANGSD